MISLRRRYTSNQRGDTVVTKESCGYCKLLKAVELSCEETENILCRHFGCNSIDTIGRKYRLGIFPKFNDDIPQVLFFDSKIKEFPVDFDPSFFTMLDEFIDSFKKEIKKNLELLFEDANDMDFLREHSDKVCLLMKLFIKSYNECFNNEKLNILQYNGRLGTIEFFGNPFKVINKMVRYIKSLIFSEKSEGLLEGIVDFNDQKRALSNFILNMLFEKINDTGWFFDEKCKMPVSFEINSEQIYGDMESNVFVKSEKGNVLRKKVEKIKTEKKTKCFSTPIDVIQYFEPEFLKIMRQMNSRSFGEKSSTEIAVYYLPEFKTCRPIVKRINDDNFVIVDVMGMDMKDIREFTSKYNTKTKTLKLSTLKNFEDVNYYEGINEKVHMFYNFGGIGEIGSDEIDEISAIGGDGGGVGSLKNLEFLLNIL